jgi:hypothetical protein
MKRTLLFCPVALAALATAAFFVVQPASAASYLPPGLASNIPAPPGGFIDGKNGEPIEVSVFEDQPSYTITEAFTITNPNAFRIVDMTYEVGCSIDGTPTAGCATFISGDSTDVVTSDSVAPGGATPCGASGSGDDLAAGASCDVVITLFLPNELDYGDFGISALSLQAAYFLPTEAHTKSGVSDLTFDVQVKDAPTPTPEPSSLLLLGTGMLGLAGVLRRKLGGR